MRCFLVRLNAPSATPAAAPAPMANTAVREMSPVGRRDRLVEAAAVPEIGLGAAQAGMSRLDREAGALVPLGGGAGVVGGRTLAAELVQAPALLRALVIKGFREQALVVERAAIAAVVDALAVEGQRTAQFIEVRDHAKGQEMCQHAGNDHRDGRAAGHVDDRLVLDQCRIPTRPRSDSGWRAECRRTPRSCPRPQWPRHPRPSPSSMSRLLMPAMVE